MIRVENLSKHFGDTVVLRDVNAEIKKGEVISIIGPSGTGKSTFLRCLNLLETPSGGRIFIDGEDILAHKTDVSRLRQKMGMVFQNFNLFEHLTVLGNLTIGPVKLLGHSPADAAARGYELLQSVGLAEKARAFPHELSGGQKQRVAIARCLSMAPEIILFDEPTSALDPTMVSEVLGVIRKLAKNGMTMAIVTHEMKFARDVSSRIFYMDEGVVYEEGAPAQIFSAPQKTKTRVFINRIRNFSFHLANADYDAPALTAGVESFCDRHFAAKSRAYRVLWTLEETLQLCFGADMETRSRRGTIIADAGGIDLSLIYAENTDAMAIELTGAASIGSLLDLNDDPDDLCLNNLRRLTEPFEEVVENERLRLTLQLKNEN